MRMVTRDMRTDRKIWKITVWLFWCTILFLGPTVLVQAATKKAEISVEDNMTSVEGIVEVGIKVNANTEVGAYFFHVTYDDTLLEYQSGAYAGGDGVLTFSGSANSKMFERKVKFIAKKQGTSPIKILMEEGDNICPLKEKDGETMKVSVKNAELLIAPITSQSSDTMLSELQLVGVTAKGETKEVNLSPVFTPQVYQYKASVGGDIEKLIVTAFPNNLHGVVEDVKGTKLKAGENLTKITVRAENGSRKSYMIYITKSKSTAATDKTEKKKAEKQQSIKGDRIKIQIGDADYYTIKDTKTVAPIEGMEWVQYAYKGDTIVITQGVVTGLKVFYLTDKAGKTGRWFLYNESTDSFSPFVALSENNMTYVILGQADSVLPPGYEKFQEKWGKLTFECYKVAKDKKFGLIYAMNGKGEKNLYRVDLLENTIQRYDSYDDANIDASASKGQLDSLLSQIAKLKKEKKQQANVKWICIIVLGIVIAVLMFLLVREKKTIEKAKKEYVIKENEGNQEKQDRT